MGNKRSGRPLTNRNRVPHHLSRLAEASAGQEAAKVLIPDLTEIVFAGDRLVVTRKVEMFLEAHFPYLRPEDYYLAADAWMVGPPRRTKKNIQKFLRNWLTGEENKRRERLRDTNVGASPQIDQRMVCCPNCQFNVPMAAFEKHRKSCSMGAKLETGCESNSRDASAIPPAIRYTSQCSSSTVNSVSESTLTPPRDDSRTTAPYPSQGESDVERSSRSESRDRREVSQPVPQLKNGHMEKNAMSPLDLAAEIRKLGQRKALP